MNEDEGTPYMSYGKTIEMFLVDGDFNGLVTAELSNWNGKAIKVPRTMVKGLDREDIRGVGVYFLLCEEDGERSVYIGEAENVLERLKQHIASYQQNKEPYYWTQAIAFVGTDLNKALIRYLEDRLFAIAQDCGRVALLTKVTYSHTKLKESQIASMEEFIENVKVLLGALGCDVLAEVPKPDDDTVHLFCTTTQGASATGFVSEGGFTVLRGSRVSDVVAPSLKTSGSYDKLRARLESDGVICDHVFTRDYEFSSPSAASIVVCGYSISGNVKWQTADGVPLKEL